MNWQNLIDVPIYPFPEFAVNIVKRKLISPEAVVSSSYLSYQRSKHYTL